jgi:tRNA uracil 4-sulfurtransferase
LSNVQKASSEAAFFLFLQQSGKVINRNYILRPTVATILVRYGETGLKGPPVRRRFEALLVENILRAHSHEKINCVVERQRGRLFVNSDDSDESVGILSRTFGIVSISKAEECTSDVDDISRMAIDSAKKHLSKGSTFAVRARRTGTHEYTSMELAAKVGEKVLEAFPKNFIKVDLENPNLEIFVEVRNNKSYVFSDKVQGPGGLPLRSQGKVLSVIEDRKSLLSSWLMMRRGCSMVFLNKSKLKASELGLIEHWNPWWSGVVEDEGVEEVMRTRHCKGLVLGWTLEEFQKKESPRPGVPVFYPLVGLVPDEIDERMRVLFG